MSETVRFDVGVIGAGPAGTLAAIECQRRGLRAALWERGRFPHDKVCGEFLSPEALPILEEEIPSVLAQAAWIDRAEFVPRRGRRCAFRLPQPGRGLSRSSIDLALWLAAKRLGVQAMEGDAVLSVRRGKPHGPSGTEFEVATNSQTESCQVCALLVTCGRWWKIDGLPSPLPQVKPNCWSGWLGIKAHFSNVVRRPAVEVYIFPGGYCGLSPIENGFYDACVLVRRSVVRSLGKVAIQNMKEWLSGIACHQALNERLRSGLQVSPTITTAPVLPARRPAAWHDVLAAGDAAGFLDTFTGDGIAMALYSGRLAGRSLAAAFEEHGCGETGSRDARRAASTLGESCPLCGNSWSGG
jgi:flavin-dependent dehydrogenase